MPFPTDSCQLDEHVRSVRAGARLWLRANTGVTRELAPAGRLGDAGRFLDWNPRCPRVFSSGQWEGKGTRRVEPHPRRSGPSALSRSGFQNLVSGQMENSNARAIGKTGARVTVGQRTRASLSLGGRCVPPVRAQEAADRDSLAALEQIVESPPALAWRSR